jgi:hypothetical protein
MLIIGKFICGSRTVLPFHRLVQRLNSSESYFLIHVDSRQDYLHRELAALAATRPNLRMASQRQV